MRSKCQRAQFLLAFPVDPGLDQIISEDTTCGQELEVGLQGVKPPPKPSPWVSVGPSAAILTNFGRVFYGGVSIEATVKVPWVPWVENYLYVSAETGYRFGSSTGETKINGRSVRTELGYAPFHLSVLFKPLPDSWITPVLGIGAGLEFVQWSIRGPSGIIERGHKTLLGSLVTAGGEVRLGTGALVLYLRYLYAYMSERAGVEQPGEDNSGSIVKGSIGGMEFSLGYRLYF